MGCCFTIKSFDAQELTQGKFINSIEIDIKNMGSTAVLDHHEQISSPDNKGKTHIDQEIIESDFSPLKLPVYSSENSIASWRNPLSP